jgi:hypothetical protein
MSINIIEKDDKSYIEIKPGELKVLDEQDAVDLIGLCGENKTNLIMIYDDNLSADFFDLKSKIAGHILQKFVNYHVRVALVLINSDYIKGRFGEMVTEANKGGDFGVFLNKEKAEAWLIN